MVHHITNNYGDKMKMLLDDFTKFRFMPMNMVLSIGLAYVLGGNRLTELRNKVDKIYMLSYFYYLFIAQLEVNHLIE